MSEEQYYFLVQEMSQLMQEVANTAGRTSFNGNNLLGNFSTSGSVAAGNLTVSGLPSTGRTGPWTFMTGAGKDDKVTVELVPIFDDALSASQTNANKGYVNGALKVGALNALYTRIAWLSDPQNSPASGEGYDKFAAAPGTSVEEVEFPMLSQKVYGESGGLTLGTKFNASSTGTSFSQNFFEVSGLAVSGQGNDARTYTNVALTKAGKDTGALASVTIGDGTAANAGKLMSVTVTKSGSGFESGDVVSFDVEKLLGLSPPSVYPEITLGPITITPPSLPTVSQSYDSNYNNGYSDATFSNFPSLYKGQSLTVEGLTFTANRTTSAAETAAAFANLQNGAVTGSGSSYGTYTGTLSSTYDSGNVNSGSVTFTRTGTTYSPIAVTVSDASTATPPNTGMTHGTLIGQETVSLSDFPPLTNGQSIEVGGLIFTANRTTSAAETAAAFANLQDGDITGSGASYGTYTGSLSNWSSGDVSGGSVIFTSTSSTGDVENLTVSAANARETIENTELIDARNKSLNDLIDDALMQINAHRSYFGAFYGRFEHNIANLSAQSENLSAALSRVQDADYGAETATLTKVQILQQAATAMLAQANAMPNVILGLLKSA